MPVTRPSRAEQGQASVELVALLPLMAVLAALLWQAVVAGQAVWLAGSAARAAARASAIGADTSAAAKRVLPDRLERGLVVRDATSGNADDNSNGSENGGNDNDNGGVEGGVRVAIAIPTIVGSGRLTTIVARARLQDQKR